MNINKLENRRFQSTDFKHVGIIKENLNTMNRKRKMLRKI